MTTNKTNRRDFLTASATGIAGALAIGNARATTPNRAKTFELEEATIADLQQKMQRREMSAREICEEYLERIRDVDQAGAQLNSIIEINPDALDIAEKIDKQRAFDNKKAAIPRRSPLFGIPILLKDNIDTADKMKTTAGSLALVDAPTPTRDAFVAEQLRKAGAIILGKTNLSEWANFRSNNSSSGWSARGGQTRNPYILDRNPCGSSSGSGASIAANLAAAAIGTETDGSIVCPASNCGLVGLKPTVGLVSRSGIIPISHSQDTAGPMTRTVTDAAILLSAITGVDQRDAATRGQKSFRDYTEFLQKDGLRGARLGVMRQYFGKNEKTDAVINSALDAMKQSGAILVDVKFPTFNKFGDAEFEVLLYEFKNDLNKYLAERNSPYKTLADLIKFNEDNRAREMPFFGQDIFIAAQKKGDLNERAYRLALQKSKTLAGAQGIDQIITQNKLDAVVAPTNAPIWMIDLINGDSSSSYIGSSSWAAVAGYPSITVPAGFAKDLPIGISFFGRAFSENILLRLAYSFEQTTKARRAPKFLLTANGSAGV